MRYKGQKKLARFLAAVILLSSLTCSYMFTSFMPAVFLTDTVRAEDSDGETERVLERVRSEVGAVMLANDIKEFFRGRRYESRQVFSTRYRRARSLDAQSDNEAPLYFSCVNRITALVDRCFLAAAGGGGTVTSHALQRAQTEAETASEDRSEGSFYELMRRTYPDVAAEDISIQTERLDPSREDYTSLSLLLISAASLEREIEDDEDFFSGHHADRIFDRAYGILGLSDSAEDNGFWDTVMIPRSEYYTEEREVLRINVESGEEETCIEEIPKLRLTYGYTVSPSASREEVILTECGLTDEEEYGVSPKEMARNRRDVMLSFFGYSFLSRFDSSVHLPVEAGMYRISCPFGTHDSLHPFGHDGTDLSGMGREGIPVYAVADGVVCGRSAIDYSPSYRSSVPDYGNFLMIDHGGGLVTVYGHLAAIAPSLTPGTKVESGRQIGIMGSTGYSTGIHLHFETRVNGVKVDPALVTVGGVSLGKAIKEGSG